MTFDQVKTIGVVGAGQMGGGIAQVAAASGYRVLLFDLSTDLLQKARAGIEKSLKKFVEKGKLAEAESRATLERLRLSSRLEDFSAAQLVIEAVTENQSVKTDLFKKLDALCPSETILASNTSTIPIGRLAAVVKRPSQVIGMHFMNPVPLMNLVEVICGFHTSPETLAVIQKTAEKMGKVVVVSKDFPGFIVNRILMPMINEAVYALYEGVASAESIDTAMKLGTNQPMGPLALADLIGLDTCLFIMEVIHEGLGDSKYRPCPLLRQYVEAGLLGRKSGRGFHSYA